VLSLCASAPHFGELPVAADFKRIRTVGRSESADSDEEIKPSHRSANLGDVDVKVSDRITLELALYTLAILHVGKP
jgi:hypothetical protein